MFVQMKENKNGKRDQGHKQRKLNVKTSEALLVDLVMKYVMNMTEQERIWFCCRFSGHTLD